MRSIIDTNITPNNVPKQTNLPKQIHGVLFNSAIYFTNKARYVTVMWHTHTQIFNSAIYFTNKVRCPRYVTHTYKLLPQLPNIIHLLLSQSTVTAIFVMSALLVAVRSLAIASRSLVFHILFPIQEIKVNIYLCTRHSSLPFTLNLRGKWTLYPYNPMQPYTPTCFTALPSHTMSSAKLFTARLVTMRKTRKCS